MNAHHKRKTSRLYLQEYLPPVIEQADTEKSRKVVKDIIADNNTKKKTDKNTLREYIPPMIDVIWVEMENGIAANSGFALPAKTIKPVDETWNNASIVPDDSIYW